MLDDVKLAFLFQIGALFDLFVNDQSKPIFQGIFCTPIKHLNHLCPPFLSIVFFDSS